MTGSLGVVIVSFNTRDLLDACLSALAADLRVAGFDAAELGAAGPGVEVWVVDNASTDGSAAMVAERHPWVQLDGLDENAGFTAANNRVLERWAAAPDRCPDWVLLLNPDTELRPGALAALVSALAAAPDVAVAGPRLVYPDGRFQHGAFRFPGIVQTWLDLFPVNRLVDSTLNGRYPRRVYARGRPFAVDFVLGACMLVRGAALRAVGPLDPGYFMYCEEIDWCRRFRAAGWRILCVPAAELIHHAGASTSQRRGLANAELWRSRRRYFRIHGSPAQRLLTGAIIRLGLARRGDPA